MEAKTKGQAETNRELVVGAIDAAMAGNMDGFTDALHPEVEVMEPEHLPYGGNYRGRDGFLELFGRATQVLDLPTLRLVSATADEERVVLLMTCRLLANGDEMHITEHWRVEDGLIREVRVFWFGLPE